MHVTLYLGFATVYLLNIKGCDKLPHSILACFLYHRNQLPVITK